MHPAQPTDWKTHPLPAQRTTITLDRAFTEPEMERIRLGFIPAGMDDRWFAYWVEPCLHLHRSWTGYCVYVVYFECDNMKWRMVRAEANRDPEQYRESSDQNDIELLDGLLLTPYRPGWWGKPSAPSPPPTDGPLCD